METRRRERRGPDWIGAELGVSPRTVSRVIARHRLPRLAHLDPMTGEVIRASRVTTIRYERDKPGDLVHMDVKKLGRIPDGGGWKALGRGNVDRDRDNGPGYDYVHCLIDDHSRFAYCEVLPDETGPTCVAFLDRAIDYFAAHGIPPIRQLITDKRLGLPVVPTPDLRRSEHRTTLHQTPLPLAERQSRTPQSDPAHRMGLPRGLHQQRRPHSRPCPLARALQH